MKVVLVLFLAITSLSAKGQDSIQLNPDSITAPSSSTKNERELKADSIIAFAKTQLGTPYRYATSKPNESFDCSGFTSYVYGHFDITKCRTSRGYAEIGEFVDRKNAQVGDCILFVGTTKGSKTIGHVGIVVENGPEGIKFIHCSSGKKNGGVVISSLDSPWYAQRFHQVRRLF